MAVAVAAGTLGVLTAMAESYWGMSNSLDSAIARIRRIQRLLSVPGVERVVGAELYGEINRKVAEIKVASEELKKRLERRCLGVPIGRLVMFLSGGMVCLGSARWRRKLDRLIGDLEEGMETFEQRVDLHAALKSQRERDFYGGCGAEGVRP